MLTTRREFLALAGSALPALSIAAPMEPDFTFALVTDTHLGRTATDEKNLAKIVDAINQSTAQFTLFAGDLVDNGQAPTGEKRYQLWKDIVKGLKREWLAVPGNHDPAEMFTKFVQEKTDHVLDTKGYRFIGFANAQPNPGHDGVVTPEQLTWLKEQIHSSKTPVVLLAHVIYHKNQHPDVGWYIQEGREEFGKLLKESPAVKVMLSGHHHCGFRGWDDTHGIHEVILPSAAYNRDRGLKDAGGYNLPEFGAGWVLVEVYKDTWAMRYRTLTGNPEVRKELKLRA